MSPIQSSTCGRVLGQVALLSLSPQTQLLHQPLSMLKLVDQHRIQVVLFLVHHDLRHFVRLLWLIVEGSHVWGHYYGPQIHHCLPMASRQLPKWGPRGGDQMLRTLGRVRLVPMSFSVGRFQEYISHGIFFFFFVALFTPLITSIRADCRYYTWTCVGPVYCSYAQHRDAVRVWVEALQEASVEVLEPVTL